MGGCPTLLIAGAGGMTGGTNGRLGSSAPLPGLTGMGGTGHGSEGEGSGIGLPPSTAVGMLFVVIIVPGPARSVEAQPG